MLFKIHSSLSVAMHRRAMPLLGISQGSRAAFVSGRRRWRSFAGWICVTQPVDGSPGCMDAVGGDFDFGNATEGEQKLYEALGWLFRSLFHHVGQQRPRTQPGTLHPRPAGPQASHARVWPGWNMTPAQRSSSCETSNARVAASAGAHSRMGICTSMCAKSSRESWA